MIAASAPPFPAMEDNSSKRSINRLKARLKGKVEHNMQAPLMGLEACYLIKKKSTVKGPSVRKKLAKGVAGLKTFLVILHFPDLQMPSF